MCLQIHQPLNLLLDLKRIQDMDEILKEQGSKSSRWIRLCTDALQSCVPVWEVTDLTRDPQCCCKRRSQKLKIYRFAFVLGNISACSHLQIEVLDYLDSTAQLYLVKKNMFFASFEFAASPPTECSLANA
ncbi:uncharacterized protein GJ701_001576 isoform 1-T1 [Geothlypis trichas]